MFAGLVQVWLQHTQWFYELETRLEYSIFLPKDQPLVFKDGYDVHTNNKQKGLFFLGVLRFGLVGDVLLAAQDPYPCSWVIFPKIGTHV